MRKIPLQRWRRNGDKHSRVAQYLTKKFVMSSLLTEGNVKIYGICFFAKELTELHKVGRVGMKLSERRIV